MRGWQWGSRHGKWGAFALGLLLGLGAGQARAADAASVESTLHDWLSALLGPHAVLGERPVRVTAEGDHFAIAVPIAGPVGASPLTLDGPPATATARSLDGGRWALDDVRLPSPLRITMPTPRGPDVWTITVQDQDQHAVIGPTLATTSSWDGRIGGYSAQWHGPQGERHSDAAHVVSHVTWQPAANGRVDVTETVSSDLVSSSARSAKFGLISFSAAHSRLDAHIDALAPDRVAPLVHAAFDLAAPMIATASSAMAAGMPPAPPPMTPEMRAALGRLLDAAGGLLGGFGERVKLDDVHIQGPRGSAALRSVEVGGSAAAPDGRLRLQLRLAMDGLDSDALPPGPLHAYLPRHIALAPRLSGVQADRVLALLHRAVATDGKDPTLASEAEAIVHDGPLAIGLDSVAADFGPATLSASGEMHILSRREVSGHAHVQITGLADLIHDAQSVPELKQALPVLIFLKGIGATEGTTTTWEIAYAGHHLTVNGTDMSQMMPRK